VTDKYNITPVILAGGVGSRLWPLSRDTLPKQLLRLVNKQTMLQNTYQRAKFCCDFEKGMILANQEYRFLIAEQMLEINESPTIILEPFGRNTAPAIAIAAFKALQEAQDGILFILPADQVIRDNIKLKEKIQRAAKLAEQDFLVTFGITPTYPATEYGYINYKKKIQSHDGFHINQFVEKPNEETAEKYIASGNYLWNSGMFIFKASCYLKELQHYAPLMFTACQEAVKKGITDLDFFRLNEAALHQCPSESIDYLIMEKTKQGAVVPLEIDWSDIGSWSALASISDKDSLGNVLIGDVIGLNSENTYLRSESRLVAAVGIKDSIIVETPDAVMVAHKDYATDIKQLVQILNKQQRTETKSHQCVYRPWGWYKTLIEAPRFKVKEIMVKPQASISLQLHKYRSEHWVVVSGKATVICDDAELLLQEGMSTYIPINTKHRLSNQQEDPLHIIEVQCGEYLGEDDIIRFLDQYGRQ